MKIAIINAHYSHILGGSEMQCHQIAEGLNRMGKNVVYVAVGGYAEDKEWPYPVIRADKSADAVAKACQQVKADIIYWRYNKNLLSSTIDEFKSIGMKVVFSVSHIHDLQPFAYKPIPNLGMIMRLRRRTAHIIKGLRFQKAFKKVDGVVCNNEQHLEHIHHTEKTYIPNSPFLEAQNFVWPRPYIVWVGNIKEHKHPELFIELAKSMSGLSVDFLMVGAIQQKAYDYLNNKSELPSNFYYLGSKSPVETNGVIKSALFLVHTCEPEGFPNVFLQAWGFARPAISMQFDPADLLKKEKLGIHSGNFERMVADCKRWTENPDELKKFGTRAENYVSKHFVKDQNIMKLVTFFLSITEK